MPFRARHLSYCFLPIACLSFLMSFGAEFPNLSFDLSFFPTENGTPVPNGAAFTRNYTLSGAEDGGLLLSGMRLQQGPNFSYATRPGAVYQYNPTSQSLSVMDTSTLLPELNWPTGIAYDSKLRRMVLVTVGDEGILYNYIVPDLANAPGDGVWTFLASMNHVDVDAITYLASQDSFFVVTFSYAPSIEAKIIRITSAGIQTDLFSLPTLPFDIGFVDYDAELIAVSDYLVLLLEPRPGANPAVKESRIYLIDPVTQEVHLTYQRSLSEDPTDMTPPVLHISAPADGAEIPLGDPIVLTAFASDDTGIQQLEFLRDGSLLGTGAPSPTSQDLYVFTWNNASIGTNTLQARATDLAGNIALSVPVSVVVYTNTPPGDTNEPPTDTTPPIVQMRSPENGETLKSSVPILLSARATDTGGVAQVQFLRNGSPLALGVNSSQQPNIYTFTWNTPPDGTNVLAARATDSSGNSAISVPVTILVVSNSVPLPANRPPMVRITFPDDGDVLTLNPIHITATASDPDGTVSVVEFFVDDQLVGTNDATSNTFSFEWTPPTNGVFELVARAVDDDALGAESDAVQITVAEPPQPDLISARRSLPEKFRAGIPLKVEIEVRAQRHIDSWLVEDRPPEGWRVIGISHGGRFDRDTGVVRFGPFKNRSHRTVRYHVVPENILGTFDFTGTVIADGQWEAIVGDTETTASLKHKHVKIEKGKGRGKIIIRFDPEDAPRWVVEYTESLKDPVWHTLPSATITISENGELTIDDPTAGASRRFYRLRLLRDNTGRIDRDDDENDRDNKGRGGHIDNGNYFEDDNHDHHGDRDDDKDDD